MELDPEKLVLIGFVASIVIWLIRLVVAYFGIDISRFWVTVVAFVVSIALGFLWTPVGPPPMGDPLALASWVVQTAVAVLGMATLVYNVLLQKILDGLGWSSNKLLAKKS